MACDGAPSRCRDGVLTSRHGRGTLVLRHPSPNGPVSTKKTIPTARLAEIERRLLSAEAAADFVPVLAAQWGRSRRSIWGYVARVRKHLSDRAAASKLSPEADAEIVRSMLLETYREARAEGDRKTQVVAAYRYAEVTGAKSAQRLDVTSGGKALASVVILPPLEPDDDADLSAVAAESGGAVALPGKPG